MQDLPRFAVTAQLVGNQTTLLLACLDHHGTGTVAKQYRGIATGPVQQVGEALGADHQHLLHHAGLYQRGSDREGIYETGAGGVEVEHGCVDGTQLLLHRRGCAWQQVVRSGGSQDDAIEVARFETSTGQRATASQSRQVRGTDMGDPTLLDAGTGIDPLI